MEKSMQVRIASVFIIFVVSLLGVVSPFWLDTKGDEFLVLKTASAGIMLGLALNHLLPESVESLEGGDLEGMSYALTCFGIILVLGTEQVAYMLMHKNKKGTQVADHETVAVEQEKIAEKVNEKEKELQMVESGIPESEASKHYQLHNHHDDHCHDRLPDGSGSVRDLIAAYIMELSIAAHSIIIGIDLGLLGPDDMNTLVILVIVLSFHQFIEGVGLGATIRVSEATLGTAKVVSFVTIFATTMSLGIVVGILLSLQSENKEENTTKGVVDALAAGSLLYLSLVEMCGPYFSSPEAEDRPLLKLAMLASFTLGAASMTILAIWA